MHLEIYLHKEHFIWLVYTAISYHVSFRVYVKMTTDMLYKIKRKFVVRDLSKQWEDRCHLLY